MQSLESIWNVYAGEKNRIDLFTRAALLIGYGMIDVDEFLDAPAEGDWEDEEQE